MEIDFEKCVKAGVEQAMRECELTIGMTLKEAVERQVAKKPIENKYNGLQADYVLYACPNCKQEFQLLEDITGVCNEQEQPFYCPECGQKIDWD